MSTLIDKTVIASFIDGHTVIRMESDVKICFPIARTPDSQRELSHNPIT